MLWPQMITISRPTSSAMAFEPGRRHLARAADRKSIARDHERLAAMHAGAKVGHQVAERAGLPTLVERVEAFRHAVGGGRDLIGIDRVALFRRVLRIPDDQRAAANQSGCLTVRPDRRDAAQAGVSNVTPGFRTAGLATCISDRSYQQPVRRFESVLIGFDRCLLHRHPDVAVGPAALVAGRGVDAAEVVDTHAQHVGAGLRERDCRHGRAGPALSGPTSAGRT